MERVKALTPILNNARDSYYNKSESIMTDYEYDNLFDELTELEKHVGKATEYSPTNTVGYEVKSKLEKVKHNHPMLSLDKTKLTKELEDFADSKDCLLMLKLDGLTVSVRYVNGELMSAETRGNGEIGEDITHNAKVFCNLPKHIDYKEELIVDGEAVISYDDFEEINSNLPEDKKYKNTRNLVSGSVRQLDSEVAQKRKIKFIAWKVIKGMNENNFWIRLESLKKYYGFDVVPYVLWSNTDKYEETIDGCIEKLKSEAKELKYPIDGLVLGYDDIPYGETLGATGHHLRSQIAFKFYDEEVIATLRDIEWSMGKTGALTPVAIFDTVEIDGSVIGRASLSNVSILKKTLGEMPYVGQIIYVTKRNSIIPKIERAKDKNGEWI